MTQQKAELQAVKKTLNKGSDEMLPSRFTQVLYLSISIPLHYVLEANIVPFTPLYLFDY